ncbi:MAG: D-alanyl-D-alanine carboxypeptidase family protein [Candidatus Omnitrophica bacterium]|nr:D-alanyl-D-alanine carboxypeptidase family protein [Candidatus Omnitrophota bacterium]
MHIVKRTRWWLTAAIAGFLFSSEALALHVQQLEPHDIDTLHAVLQVLEPSIAAQKSDGRANLLAWEQLYTPLNSSQRAFIDAFRALKAEALGATSHYFGEEPVTSEIVPVGTQQTVKDGLVTPLDPQYLPRRVLDAYQRMMDAMQKDLGKQLLVESGYRSPAYQLYLFMFYLPKHGHSIKETNRFVALPGYSEHGNPARQAIDFINEAGINGEDHPEEFEALPEYAWLQQHAKEFGFFLSYPRNNTLNTSFEPWHWHYEEGTGGRRWGVGIP